MSQHQDRTRVKRPVSIESNFLSLPIGADVGKQLENKNTSHEAHLSKQLNKDKQRIRKKWLEMIFMYNHDMVGITTTISGGTRNSYYSNGDIDANLFIGRIWHQCFTRRYTTLILHFIQHEIK